ncbi:hypothetical protein D3C76_1332780 [compost metagenome]
MVFAQRAGHSLPTSQQLGLFQAVLHTFATALERLVDRFGAGGKSTLKLRQGETYGALALTIELVSPIHFVAHVLGDFVV